MALRATLATLMLVTLLAGCGAKTEDSDPTVTGGTSRQLTSGEARVDGVIVDGTTYSILLTKFDGHSSPQFTQNDNDTLPEVPAGTQFEFTMQVQGSVKVTSNHIGGHYGPSPNPTATAPGGCTHQTGEVPGTYTVTCQAVAEKGLYHFRGHVRVGEEGGYVHWWSENLRFRIV